MAKTLKEEIERRYSYEKNQLKNISKPTGNYCVYYEYCCPYLDGRERSNWCKVYKNAGFYGHSTVEKAPSFCKFPNVKKKNDIDKDEIKVVKQIVKEEIREIRLHLKEFRLTLKDVLTKRDLDG